MKVLYVCRANVGRSQVAMEFHNQIRPGEATSAGTIVDIPGQQLKERGEDIEVIEAMKQFDVDMSNNKRTQLTEDMLDKFDHVIMMAEPETVPSYAKNNPKVIYWEVEDIKDKSLSRALELCSEIKGKVEALWLHYELYGSG